MVPKDEGSENVAKTGNEQETKEQRDEHEASEESAIQVKIVKSATEKCDREVVAKMKSFRDLKAKRAAAEEDEKKLQLAMQESDDLIVALFDMPNSNRYNILSKSIFCQIFLSILIVIFSRKSILISIFSRMTMSISISISISASISLKYSLSILITILIFSKFPYQHFY